MRLPLYSSIAGLALLALVGGTHFYSQRMLGMRVRQAAAQERAMPKRILWVWERAEDLHTIDSASTGVAILEETLRLGGSVAPIMRRQPLLLPERVRRIAVVRIEIDPGFSAHIADPALLQSAVVELSRISRERGTAALQIDFDATKSEHGFYRQLLEGVRQQMPASVPLDITALVSWCSTDDWIGDLPINAATPMFFRMEPDRRRVELNDSSEYQIHEPLCSSSVGVSTTEPWPQDISGRRVFVFADRGWARDIAGLPNLSYTHSATDLEHP